MSHPVNQYSAGRAVAKYFQKILIITTYSRNSLLKVEDQVVHYIDMPDH